MNDNAPITPTPAPTQIDLANHDFRIRGITVTMVIDIYDSDGFQIARGDTDPVRIIEADFPPALVTLLKKLKPELARGFAERAPTNGSSPVAPEPVPAPGPIV